MHERTCVGDREKLMCVCVCVELTHTRTATHDRHFPPTFPTRQRTISRLNDAIIDPLRWQHEFPQLWVGVRPSVSALMAGCCCVRNINLISLFLHTKRWLCLWVAMRKENGEKCWIEFHFLKRCRSKQNGFSYFNSRFAVAVVVWRKWSWCVLFMLYAGTPRVRIRMNTHMVDGRGWKWSRWNWNKQKLTHAMFLSLSLSALLLSTVCIITLFSQSCRFLTFLCAFKWNLYLWHD